MDVAVLSMIESAIDYCDVLLMIEFGLQFPNVWKWQCTVCRYDTYQKIHWNIKLWMKSVTIIFQVFSVV